MNGPLRMAVSTVMCVMLLSVTGCIATSEADREKMRSELRPQLAQINLAASLALESYGPLCPRPEGISVEINCFTVSIPNRPTGYVGAYLIETDRHAGKQTVAFRGTDNLDDGW